MPYVDEPELRSIEVPRSVGSICSSAGTSAPAYVPLFSVAYTSMAVCAARAVDSACASWAWRSCSVAAEVVDGSSDPPHPVRPTTRTPIKKSVDRLELPEDAPDLKAGTPRPAAAGAAGASPRSWTDHGSRR